MADSSGLTIIATLGAIIIGLFVITLIIGGVANTAQTNPSFNNTGWETMFDGMDSQTSSSMNIATILPIVVVGMGVFALVVGAFRKMS